jgi:very-short-patch-repair endonuclease
MPEPPAPDPGADADDIIHAFAARQHGLVARRQLIAAGVPLYTIDHRVGQRRLRRVHRGVYRVGPISPPYEREMAAVLACGETAVLSHSSATALLGLLPPLPATAPVEVTIRRGLRISDARVRVHRTSRLPADEVTALHGIPITTVARTLLDVASQVSARALEQAVAAADRERLASHDEIARLIARYPRRPGTPLLRAFIAAPSTASFTRSEAESRFLLLVRRARLRAPEVNARVEGFEVDFAWRAERLVVEVDGHAFHSSRTARARDHHRDGVLAAAGWRVIRVSWHQITAEPEALVAQVTQALAAGRIQQSSGVNPVPAPAPPPSRSRAPTACRSAV